MGSLTLSVSLGSTVLGSLDDVLGSVAGSLAFPKTFLGAITDVTGGWSKLLGLGADLAKQFVAAR